MNADKLKNLQIQPGQKRRRQRPFWTILIVVATVTFAAVYFAWPRAEDNRRVMNGGDSVTLTNSASENTGTASATSKNSDSRQNGDVVLTVSGYIINREHIELSPRFLGVVK
ncbi:MAG TPA: efflux RND transporter periplasmic adaptor subunit, partial [Verrucomicrobiae bacterium]|nr:efflux RND transporter periplasmic adaptor subunit [Verrucomicrobiae bacterium]